MRTDIFSLFYWLFIISVLCNACFCLLPIFLLMYNFSYCFVKDGYIHFVVVVVVQSPSCIWLFATPWTAAHQAFLSLTISWGLPRFMSIESAMPSNHLILCHPLLLLPSILPSIRVFSNELASPIRWPEYWSFSFRISPSNEYSGWISFRID